MTLSRGYVLAILAGLLIALLVGVAVVGSGLEDRSPFAITPIDGSQEPRTTTSPIEPSDCPGVERPSELRVTELVLPDIDTGPLGRPVIAGCAVWFTSGDNNGGIHRVDLATGAVTNVNPAEVMFDIDADGDDLLTLGRPALLEGAASATLFRLDPVTGAVLGQIPVDQRAMALRVIDGRAWVGGWRVGLIVYDLADGTVVASWPAGEVSVMEVGADAVWTITSSAQGPALGRIDRSTLRMTTVPVPRDYNDIAAVGDRIFVGSQSGTISQIDSAGAVLSTAQISGWTEGSVTLAAEGSSVWVLPIVQIPAGTQFRLESTELLRIDAETGRITDRIEYAAAQPIDLWATDGNLWLYEAHRPVRRFELPR